MAEKGMKDKKAIQKVAVFGYFGAGNLGDEAVVDILVENIRRRVPKVEISAICLVPHNASKQHGIPAYPLRRLPRRQSGTRPADMYSIGHVQKFSFSALMKGIARKLSIIAPRELFFLLHSYTLMRGYDLVVVGGSGQLVDNEGGSFNHPYNHFKWTILAKLTGAHFIFFSVGAGPLNSRLGKWFIKKSLSSARYCSFRDEYSRVLAQHIGVKGDLRVFPDQAFALHVPDHPARTNIDTNNLVVGVAPIAYCDPRHWSESKLVAYQAYVMKMASFVGWLIEKGHKIVFFHTQVDGDDRSVNDIFMKLHHDTSGRLDGSISVLDVHWHPDAIAAIAKTDVVVASRFHAVIFSYVMNKPVVAVSYDGKINNMMASLRQDQFAIDIAYFEVEDLRRKFEQMKESIPENKAIILERTQEFKKLIQYQYDQVFGEEGL